MSKWMTTVKIYEEKWINILLWSFKSGWLNASISVKIPKPEREIDLGEGDDKHGKFEVTMGHPGRDLELNRQNQSSGLKWKANVRPIYYSRCENGKP